LIRSQSSFRTQWDRLLGTESQVRALRVLDETVAPMSVRELARRAKVQLRAMQQAVVKLETAGLVERIGTGSHQKMQLRREHPLAPALRGLFEAERSRVERVLNWLKEAARGQRQAAEAIWLEGPLAEGVDDGDGALVVGIMARSDRVDAVVDAFREKMGDLMRREDVRMEVRGWTRADLEAVGRERAQALAASIPLLGVPPASAGEEAPARGRGARAHADIDAELRLRGGRVAVALARRPELLAQAREEIARRLATAPAQESRTLREWQQLLQGLSPQRLRRWLVDPGEQATRLRQSMPLTFLKAAGGPARQRRKG
jgi:DNA-binding transcriptional ArsR family regulator